MPASARRPRPDLQKAGEPDRRMQGRPPAKARQGSGGARPLHAVLPDEMGEPRRGDKEASPIPDPGLIFRAELGAGVHDEALRSSLAGAKN